MSDPKPTSRSERDRRSQRTSYQALQPRRAGAFDRTVSRSHSPNQEKSASDQGSIQQYFDRHLADKAETWDEDRTRFKPVLVIRGSSYSPSLLMDVPPCPTDPEVTPESFLLRSPSGEFAYMNRLWKRGNPIPLLQNRREGVVCWDSDVVIPVLLDGNSLAVWMSVTPMEVLTLREGISQAKGTVVLGGLGMGYLLRKVCQKSNVDRVIVVEKSRELLDWFGKELCSRYSKVTDIICGDAYEQLGRHGNQARYLFDIWPSYGDAAMDQQFQSAQRKFPHLWGWGNYQLQ